MTTQTLNPILAAEQEARAKGATHYAQWCKMMVNILHEACHCVVMIGHTTDDDYVTFFGSGESNRRRKSGGRTSGGGYLGGFMQHGQLDNPLLESEICLAGVAYENLLLDAAGVTDEDVRYDHIHFRAGGDLVQSAHHLKEWEEYMERGYRVYNRHPRHTPIPEPRRACLAWLRKYLETHWPAVEFAAEYMMRNWKPCHIPTKGWSAKVRKVIKNAEYRKKNAGWAHTRPPMDFLKLISCGCWQA